MGALERWLDTISVGDVVAFLIAIGAVSVGIRWVWPVMRGLHDLVEIWQGRPARPGVDAEPGIPERLRRIENVVGDIDYNVKGNSGGSAYDHMRAAVKELDARVTDMLEAIAELYVIARRHHPDDPDLTDPHTD